MGPSDNDGWKTEEKKMYVVESWINNGYRCCCHQIWDKTHYCKTWDEVLELIPQTCEEAADGVAEYEEVTVRDASGEIVGELKLEWPMFGRGYYYKASRWKGHLGDKKIDDCIGVPDGMTYDEYVEQLKKEKHEFDVKQAEQKLENAKRELEALK